MLLEGVTVLEVGNGVPVGYAGRVLRSLGATVVKVEEQEAPDWVRGYGARSRVRSRLSCAYVHLNGAKHRALAPSGEPGVEAVGAIIPACDVILLGSGSLAHGVSQIQPTPCDVVRIVGTIEPATVASLPADETAGVAAGWRDPYGSPTPPEGLRFDEAEMNAGLHAASLAALALVRPDRDDSGPVAIEVGVYEAAFSLIEIAAQTLLLSERFESEAPNIIGSPMAEPYRCRDGRRMVINVWGRDVWARTCAAIDKADLLGDPRFEDTYSRFEFAGDLYRVLVDWCRTVDRDTAIERLWAQRVPSAPVYDVAEFAEFPQLRARGMITQDDATMERLVGSPYVINGTRPAMPLTHADGARAVLAAMGATLERTNTDEVDPDAAYLATV